MANYDVELNTQKNVLFVFLAPYGRTTRYEEAFLPEGKKRPRSLRSLGLASLSLLILLILLLLLTPLPLQYCIVYVTLPKPATAWVFFSVFNVFRQIVFFCSVCTTNNEQILSEKRFKVQTLEIKSK